MRGARRIARQDAALPEEEPGAPVAGVERDDLLQAGDGVGVVPLRRLRGRQVDARLRVVREAHEKVAVDLLRLLGAPLQERRAGAHPVPEARRARAERLLRAVGRGERLLLLSEARRDRLLERGRGEDVVAGELVAAPFLVRPGRGERRRLRGLRLGSGGRARAELAPHLPAQLLHEREEALGIGALGAQRLRARGAGVEDREPQVDAHGAPRAAHSPRHQPVDAPEPAQLAERALVVAPRRELQVRDAREDANRVDDSEARLLGEVRGEHLRDPRPRPFQVRVGRLVLQRQDRDRARRLGGRGARLRGSRRRGSGRDATLPQKDGETEREADRGRDAPRPAREHAATRRVEVREESPRISVPPRGPALQAPVEDAPHVRRQAHPERLDVARAPAQPLCDDLARRAGLEWQLRRQHLEEDDPERVEVAPRVHGFSGHLLRREVVERADDEARARQPASLERAREPEVRDRRAAVRLDQDVPGLQVAVDDARLVRLREALGDLSQDRERALER